MEVKRKIPISNSIMKNQRCIPDALAIFQHYSKIESLK